MNETVLHNDILNVSRYTGFDAGNVFDIRQRYRIIDLITGALIILSAEQWESLRAALGAEHPGIELRISNLSGELMRADSDHLHYAARLIGGGVDGWVELLPGEAWAPDTPLPARLKIEIRPVTLGGAVGDGDGDADGPAEVVVK